VSAEYRVPPTGVDRCYAFVRVWVPDVRVRVVVMVVVGVTVEKVVLRASCVRRGCCDLPSNSGWQVPACA